MPAAVSRKEQADATRERLIEEAWQMVSESGLAAFTIRKLAVRAGVATGLPFAHFGNRDGLVDQLRMRAWDEVDRVAEKSLGTEPRFDARIDYESLVRRSLHAVVKWALDHPYQFELLAYTHGAVVSAEVGERDMRSAQRFIKLLLLGRQHGVFDFKNGDPIVFALSLWTGVQGHIQRMSAEVIEPLRKYQEKVLDHLLDTFFASIRATKKAGGK